MKDFTRISSLLGELPTLPVVVARVLEVVEDTHSSASDLVDIIQNDQAIASKVLKVANSAYYGLAKQVRSIGHAVVLLGFETVRNLSLGVGVFRSFLPYGLQQALDLERFWEHTIATGVCARMLWHQLKREDSEEVFLAGLIHDIGRLAFLSIQPKQYGVVLRKARRAGRPMVEAEQEEFGGTHAELGALLCGRWSFSPGLTDPVRFHHNLADCGAEHALTTAGVALGNCLSHQQHIGWAVDAVTPAVPQVVLDTLGLTSSQAGELGEQLENRRSEIESFTLALM